MILSADGRRAVASARQAYPSISIGYFRRGFPYKDPAHREARGHCGIALDDAEGSRIAEADRMVDKEVGM